MELLQNEYIGTLDTEDLSRAVVNKMQSWDRTVEANGIIEQWRQNYQLYYGLNRYSYLNQPMGMGLIGDNSDFMMLRVNHFRNILQHILSMVYAKRRAFKSVASNTDPDALNSTNLFDSILEYTLRIKRVDRVFKNVGELGLVFGTGALFAEWDTFKGSPYATDGNMIVNSGDLRVRAKAPFDFYTDMHKTEWDDVDWVIVRDYVNKYVLAANFPDMADEILKVKRMELLSSTSFFTDITDCDDIPIYKFFHKRIPGLMPDGRYAIIVGKDLVPYDGANPYDEIPLFLNKPSDWYGTFYGYTVANDLAPLQQFYDLVASTIATNVTAWGVPNIVGRTGADIQASELPGGMKYLQIAPGMELPQALNLLSTNPELYQLLQMVEGWMQVISGVNSVVRGNPETSLKSGTALSIVQSQAVQFASSFEASASNLEEDAGNFFLRLYKKFANTKQVISIIGKNKINQIKQWDKDDIQLVNSVYVERVDPLSQTIAGRMQMAQDLLSANMVTNPQEYITVMTTGQIEPMYQGPQASNNLIRRENEYLLEGQRPPVYRTDKDEFHIPEHEVILSDPLLRMKAQENPAGPEAMIVANTLEHIAFHEQSMAMKMMAMAPAVGQEQPQPGPQPPAQM